MDAGINVELAAAFGQKRCFPFFADEGIVTALRDGAEPEAFGARLVEIRDAMLAAAADGDVDSERRLHSDARLRLRLIDAVIMTHVGLARADHPSLPGRRFVLVRERPQNPVLFVQERDRVLISHVGKGPGWVETPTIYLCVSLFDVLADERRRGEDRWLEAFVSLLGVEERAIETGYERIEEVAPGVQQAIDALSAEVLNLAAPQPERAVAAADRRRPGRFTETLRTRYTKRLDARLPQDPMRFDQGENVQAVKSLERLARRYKREGDGESLSQVARLLVAASGHDVHEVRNRANLLMERIMAPKEFDAPLASRFVNVRRGTVHRFVFELPSRRADCFVRLYRNEFSGEFPTEKDLHFEDLHLAYDPRIGKHACVKEMNEHGHVDFVVMRRGRKHERLVDCEGGSGRINVVDDVRGELILEVFTDIHGHARTWWADGTGHPGMVYNENGEVIRLGRFSDVEAHLDDLKRRYGITALYLLGVQKRGTNREDWASDATSPSPFSPMSLTEIEPSLGGETELTSLVAKAHELGIKIVVDLVPHVNRQSKELADDCIVHCLDSEGRLVSRASTDGRFGSWSDGKLPNWRKLEVWRWLRDGVLSLIDRFGIDGVRFDIGHAVPIMMKRENAPVIAGRQRSHEEMLDGAVISNEKVDNHLITTGFFDSACRDVIAVPLQQYLGQAVERKLRQKARTGFVNIAECYWGHERYLARSGVLPYNSALFKICESISHGKGDVRQIYNLYENHYASALPEGTVLVGILGNHDERRAVNTFGERGLRPAVALTVFLSDIVMDYEGSAEGEGWKVYLDNVHVNWNRFESAANRSLLDFYEKWYGFHRKSSGRSRLVRTDHTMVAAAVKECTDGTWLGLFNFTDETLSVSMRFEDPELPLDDDEWYRMVDTIYSPITGQHGYFTGKELRQSTVRTVVPFTDRVKLLKLERVVDREAAWPDMMRNSFYRMRDITATEAFGSSFAFSQIHDHAGSYDDLVGFLVEKLLPVFDAGEMDQVEMGLKRAMYHMTRTGRVHGKRALSWIRRMAQEKDSPIGVLGERLEFHNRRGPMVFLSAEAEPFSKSGGLANVVYELPRELAAMGEDVTVVTPMYRRGNDKAVAKMQAAVERHGVRYSGRNVLVRIQGQEHSVGVHEGRVDGVRYLLLDHDEFFDGLYWGYTAVEKIRRRVGFARACASVIEDFGLFPMYTFTNDAYAGLYNAIVRSDPGLAEKPCFKDSTLLHIIHNGGWQYFDNYFRWEGGMDLFWLFGLPGEAAGAFMDPVRPGCINSMAASIRHTDRVFTVSPSYASQIEMRCDGLEGLLHDVVGVSNAVGPDLEERLRATFVESGFVDDLYPELSGILAADVSLRERVESRWPEIMDGPHGCEQIEDLHRRVEVMRVRNKLLLQIERGLDVDPDRILFTMIHRITEQKGFKLLLEASEGVVKTLGMQGVVGGAYSSGDQIGERLCQGLEQLQRYYPRSISFRLGYQDVAIPLLRDLRCPAGPLRPCGARARAAHKGNVSVMSDG